MAITLHSLSPARGARTKSFRIGRGHGTGRGKTAGRGTKGQRSRTGGRNKLKLKGMKQLLLAFPKNRGFQSLDAKPVTIRLGMLSKMDVGTRVSLSSLRAAGFIMRSDRAVKIVAGGELTKPLVFDAKLAVSATAREAIERAGGRIA